VPCSVVQTASGVVSPPPLSSGVEMTADVKRGEQFFVRVQGLDPFDPGDIGRRAVERARDGLSQHREGGAPPHATCLPHREDPLHPAISHRVVSALPQLAPAHRTPQGPFGAVVGGLYAGFHDQCPQSTQCPRQRTGERPRLVFPGPALVEPLPQPSVAPAPRAPSAAMLPALGGQSGPAPALSVPPTPAPAGAAGPDTSAGYGAMVGTPSTHRGPPALPRRRPAPRRRRGSGSPAP
jgi:hypothetical protein